MIVRRGFMIASVVWVALLPLAAFAATQPAPSPVWHALAFAVYGAGHVVCHQLPERSFHLWSAQLPVCARCTGIYVGGAIAAILATLRRRPTVRPKPDTTYDQNMAVLPRHVVARFRYVVSGFRRTSTGRVRLGIAVAALPTLATLVYEWTTGNMPSNAVRAFAGAPLGAAIAWIICGVEDLRRPVLDTREHDGASASASGGGAPRDR